MNLIEQAAEAMESALKTIEFEQHPFRPWHIELRNSLSAFRAELAKPPLWAVVDGEGNALALPRKPKSIAEEEMAVIIPLYHKLRVAPVRVLVEEGK